MRSSVLSTFPSFTAGFEGRLSYMYTDVKGLVTTGVGNLIDPIGAALGLPWKNNSDGSAASQDEIIQEWNTVKSAWPGVQSTGDHAITQLHLDPADIDALVASKAQQNDTFIRGQFAGYDNWPGDAQLAIHSMAWAQGANFAGWPHLSAALNAQPPDFMTAAGPPGDPSADTSTRGQAWLNDTGNPGLRPRNLANKILFQNAARVLAQGWDPSEVYYPTEIPEGAAPPPGSGGLLATAGKAALVTGLLGAAGYGAMAFGVFKPPGWLPSFLKPGPRARRRAHA
jgi:hypothetical protein